MDGWISFWKTRTESDNSSDTLVAADMRQLYCCDRLPICTGGRAGTGVKV